MAETNVNAPGIDQARLDVIGKEVAGLATRLDDDMKKGVAINPNLFAQARNLNRELLDMGRGKDITTLPTSIMEMIAFTTGVVKQSGAAAEAEAKIMDATYPGNSILEKLASDRSILAQHDNHAIAEVLLASAGQRNLSFSENEKKLQAANEKYKKATDELLAVNAELASYKARYSEAEKKLAEPPSKKQRMEDTGFTPAGSSVIEEKTSLVASKQSQPARETFSMGPLADASYRSQSGFTASPYFSHFMSNLKQ